jgi:hypothetical protein
VYPLSDKDPIIQGFCPALRRVRPTAKPVGPGGRFEATMAELILYCTTEDRAIARIKGIPGTRIRKKEMVDGLEMVHEDEEAERRLIDSSGAGRLIICPYCHNPLSIANESTPTDMLKMSPLQLPLGSFRFPQ